MKKVLNRLLVIILIVFILNNFLLSSFTNVVYASDDPIGDTINWLLSTVVGMFFWLPKIIAVGIGYAVDALEGTIAFAEGRVSDSGEFVDGGITALTPLDILFNKVAITDINFFKVSPTGGSTKGAIIYEIRSNIAVWYYIMRNIAAAILLVVLIYIGIRMAITTVATDKALYKKMLVDWICSLALIFLLQYIAIFVINLNEALVKVIEGASGIDSEKLRNMILTLAKDSLLPADINSIAAAAVFCMIVIQTFALFISYFSRMLKLAFLLIISPLITLTYAIDKIGDGKAQALGNWLREFVFTILIQPFHCIIYIVFISMSIDIINNNSKNTMAGAIIAILCLKFTKDAEKIVRKIFAFKNDEGPGSIAAGLTMSAAALGMAQKIGKGTRTLGNQLGNIGNRISNDKNQLLATGMAIRMGREQKNSGTGEVESLTDRRAAALEELNTLAEAKKLEKANKKYKNSNGYLKTTDENINARAQQILEQSRKDGKNMTMSQAKAQARLARAKENKERIKNANGGKMPKIKGARGIVEGAKTKYNQIASVMSRLEIPKMAVAAGAGFFTAAASYGAGANVGSAITNGLAANKGMEEFLKNSTRNLTTDINDRMKSMGVADVDEQNSRFDEIIAKGNNEEYNDKTFKNILKQIETALKAQGMSAEDSKNIRYSVQNSINKDLTKNPGKSVNAVVKDSLDKVISTDAFKALSSGGQMKASMDLSRIATNYAMTKQESSIFQTITTAGELGIDPNRLADLSNSRFDASSVYTTSVENGASDTVVMNEENITASSVKSLDESDLKNVKEMLEKHMKDEKNVAENLRKELEEMIKSGKATQQVIDAKNKEIEEINSQINEITRRINYVENEIKMRMPNNNPFGENEPEPEENNNSGSEDDSEADGESQNL